MSKLTGLILFSILIVFSLVVVSFANRTQTRNQIIRQKIQQFRLRIDELEEICLAIEPLLESVLIPKMINEDIIGLINNIQKLDPGATSLEVKLQQAQTLATQLEAEQRVQPLNRVMPNDAAIKKSQHFLTEAARIVRKHQAAGHIDRAEMESFIHELAWAHLMVEALSFIVQGHKSVSRDDGVVAFGYYRRAQNILMSNQTSDSRRHRMIRELSEILEGKRLALSPELMPETEFNPTQKPTFGGKNSANPKEATNPESIPSDEYKAKDD